jgi:hypothetical protein
MDERYEKFAKMQRMNVPEGAIRVKMGGEGFTPEEVEAFFNGDAINEIEDTFSTSSRPTLETNSPSNNMLGAAGGRVKSWSSDQQSLEPTEDRFANFIKMLQANLPEDSIKLKMQMVGFTSQEIEGMFASQGINVTAPAAPRPLSIKGKDIPPYNLNSVSPLRQFTYLIRNSVSLFSLCLCHSLYLSVCYCCSNTSLTSSAVSLADGINNYSFIGLRCFPPR